MPETRSSQPGGSAGRLGYALNAFPYHTLAELWDCLETDILLLKERVSPTAPFPIELRLSEPLVRELTGDRAALARLKHFLDVHVFALVTVNAFVLPRFHGQPVKERVYLPAWHESDVRRRFTCDALDLVADLAPPEQEFVSASVPFGALKPVTMVQIAPPILRAAAHAQQLHARTGRRAVVALEPEPGLTVETTPEIVAFFDQHVPADLRPYLGVNFDLSHQLVQFEDLGASLALLRRQEIPLAKIHVTNAAELPAPLQPFYHDSVYLHQVCGVDAAGRRAYFALDWPASPPPAEIVTFRVHYHLPVCPSALPSTLAAVDHFLRAIAPQLPPAIPLIIETYTWPQRLGGRAHLVDNIARELEWVRGKLSA